MKRFIVTIIAILVISGCVTNELAEPKRSTKDPSLVRLQVYLGGNRKSMMSKLEKRYGVIQKKYGNNGRFYNPTHSFTYFYEGDKLVKLVLPVQQQIPHFRAYTGKLPFGLLRKDTHESVVKKLGQPSSQIMDKTMLKYNAKKLTIFFDKGTIGTVILEAK